MELVEKAVAVDSAARAFLSGTGEAASVTAAVRAFRAAADRSFTARGGPLIDDEGNDWTDKANALEGAWSAAAKRGGEAMRKTVRVIRKELEPFTAYAVA